jgi:catechol 2,3-dioxygenase-like lactoylglutathione lyase family enzyme
MLAHSDVATRLPVQDLERARAFYSDKLGLEPAEERPGGLRYRCGSGAFALFVSAGAAAGTHTQMSWEVTDLEATGAALRDRSGGGELSEPRRDRREGGLVQGQRGEPARHRAAGAVSSSSPSAAVFSARSVSPRTPEPHPSRHPAPGP